MQSLLWTAMQMCQIEPINETITHPPIITSDAFVTTTETATTNTNTNNTLTTTNSFSSDTALISENNDPQQSLNNTGQSEPVYLGEEFVLFKQDLCNQSEIKQSEITNSKVGVNVTTTTNATNTSESLKISQANIDATISAIQHFHLNEHLQEHRQLQNRVLEQQELQQHSQHQQQQNKQQTFHSAPVNEISPVSSRDKLGYHLRALRQDISALEANPWIPVPDLPQIIQPSTLSNELVNETLNYFVNCGTRLSQMTKTYNDSDAYILLLQEKEVDLELAARIGQDLLKQNKQLKESINNLENELIKRQEDVQQLKHELASKISLLDTFIEEEEHQTNLGDNGKETSYCQQQEHITDKPGTSTSHLLKSTSQTNQNLIQTSPTVFDNHDEDYQRGFSSLNYHNQETSNLLVEPFSSLQYHVNKALNNDQFQHRETYDQLGSSTSEDYNSKTKDNQSGIVETVTFQLVESNKRLCELQDELIYKSEQSLLQQEKIYHLQEQLRETDRRLDDVASENEALQKSILDSGETQKELKDELKACKNNFSELLKVFLELQKETRLNKLRDFQQNSNAPFFCSDLDPVNDMANVSFDSYNSQSYENFNNNNNFRIHRQHDSSNLPVSSSLLEELQESMVNSHHMEEDDDSGSDSGEATDSAESRDSGVHTKNISSSGSLSKVCIIASDTDSEEPNLDDSKSKKNWLGFSTFMFTTLLLLCVSVSFTTSSNSNLAARLRIKLDR